MENKPLWKTDLEFILLQSKVAANKNPGASLIFNGNHWVPVEKVLPQFDNLSTISNEMADALKAVHSLFVANGHLGYEAHLVREALKTYDLGIPSK